MENSSLKPVFPSKVPSPHLLSPKMGKKGSAGMERRWRGKGRKGEGKGEQKERWTGKGQTNECCEESEKLSDRAEDREPCALRKARPGDQRGRLGRPPHLRAYPPLSTTISPLLSLGVVSTVLGRMLQNVLFPYCS